MVEVNEFNKYKLNFHIAGLEGHGNFGLGNFFQYVTDRIRDKRLVKNEVALVKGIPQVQKEIHEFHDIEKALSTEAKLHRKAFHGLQYGYDVQWTSFMLLKHVLLDIEQFAGDIRSKNSKKAQEISRELAGEVKKYKPSLKKFQRFNLALDAKAKGKEGVALLLAEKLISKKGYYWNYLRLRGAEKREFKDVKSIEAELKKEMKAINNNLLTKKVTDDIKGNLQDLFKNAVSFSKRCNVLLEELVMAIFELIGVNMKSVKNWEMPHSLTTKEITDEKHLLGQAMLLTHNVNMMINQLFGYYDKATTALKKVY